MRLVDHPEVIEAMRTPTEEDPWRVLFSACMLGAPVGVNGTDYGLSEGHPEWWSSTKIAPVGFCPEAFGMGVPRTMPDIHGGDGFAVLDGEARVLDEHGEDLTEAMVAGAEAMAAFANNHKVELAILTDLSAACGTQVIFDGCRYDEPRRYQRGVGVAAALLIRNDIAVVSYRDYRTLDLLRLKVEPGTAPDTEAIDCHQTKIYRDYFG